MMGASVKLMAPIGFPMASTKTEVAVYEAEHATTEGVAFSAPIPDLEWGRGTSSAYEGAAPGGWPRSSHGQSISTVAGNQYSI
jgi:hypothetical protein